MTDSRVKRERERERERENLEKLNWAKNSSIAVLVGRRHLAAAAAALRRR